MTTWCSTSRERRSTSFLEYYILAEGQIWDRIFHVLRERAAAGVEVRIIFDDFGNLTRLSDAIPAGHAGRGRSRWRCSIQSTAT